MVLGGQAGDRTLYLRIAKPTLFRMSYKPTMCVRGKILDHPLYVVGIEGFEPSATRFQSEYATRLRQTPMVGHQGVEPRMS